MKLEIENNSFEVELENNTTVKALLNMLPMTITMEELNGNEKYFYLDTKLPTNTKNVGQINAGDIMLWGNNCLVLFYKSFSTSYSYTKIGRLKDSTTLQNIIGKGSIQVELVI